MKELKIDEKIDLRGVLCSTNFVKTNIIYTNGFDDRSKIN